MRSYESVLEKLDVGECPANIHANSISHLTLPAEFLEVPQVPYLLQIQLFHSG